MKHIIIIGGGFGGLTLAKKLANKKVQVTLIDRTNHHLFQPLLYQVATAALAPGDIAVPIRSVFKKAKNIQVIMAEVVSVDASNKRIHLENDESLTYDKLVIATGARHSYFGNNEWEALAPGLKTLNDALRIREGILKSLELAERESDHAKRRKYLTFVIVGAGPTGVEIAGSIAEITRKSVIKDFKHIRPEDTRIILVEGQSHVLMAYDEDLRLKAEAQLRALGVEILKHTMVKEINKDGVRTETDFIGSVNVIWAAGNQASPLLKTLGVELGRFGRIKVQPDLSVPGLPDVYVIGDAAYISDSNGDPLPAVAPVAIQQGQYLGRHILREASSEPFVYKNKGNMATIGRAKGIADFGKLKMSGYLAWLMWSFVHIFYLIGFRNRFRVMAEWIWYYLSFRGSFRLITGRK